MSIVTKENKKNIIIPKEIWNLILKEAFKTEKKRKRQKKWLKYGNILYNLDQIKKIYHENENKTIIMFDYWNRNDVGTGRYKIELKKGTQEYKQVSNYLSINLQTLEPFEK